MQPNTPTPSTTLSLPAIPKDSHLLPCLLLTSLLLLLLLLLHSTSPASSPSAPTSAATIAASLPAASSEPSPPALAYLLSGSAGDADRLLRLLFACYHPRNLYLLFLDRAAPDSDRSRIAHAVSLDPAFARRGNVHVVGSPGFANPRGASALSVVLHGAAVLLRLDRGWDWFVPLDAGDYPLVTQDDLLHVLSYVPRDLNFIQHTSYIGWRESRQIRPIVVDPGLYLSSRTDIFYATQKRDLPNAYRLFTGSSSVILSRKFIEYCVIGTDNLPRTLLMYYTNMPSPHKKYFQTVLCNSPEFNRTAVNHSLHYVTSDMSPKNEPRVLILDDVKNITQSGAAFGARFSKDDPVLDHIDREILGRTPGKPVPGGWCMGEEHGNPCAVSGNPDVLRPGPGAAKLARLLAERLSYQNFYSQQCIWD